MCLPALHALNRHWNDSISEGGSAISFSKILSHTFEGLVFSQVAPQPSNMERQNRKITIQCNKRQLSLCEYTDDVKYPYKTVQSLMWNSYYINIPYMVSLGVPFNCRSFILNVITPYRHDRNHVKAGSYVLPNFYVLYSYKNRTWSFLTLPGQLRT